MQVVGKIYHRTSQKVNKLYHKLNLDGILACPVVLLNQIVLTQVSDPKTSSIIHLTRCTFSSLICTKMLPLSVNKSLATIKSVAQISKVGVNTERPCIAVGLDLLTFAG